jgi:hypothetical protein
MSQTPQSSPSHAYDATQDVLCRRPAGLLLVACSDAKPPAVGFPRRLLRHPSTRPGRAAESGISAAVSASRHGCEALRRRGPGTGPG